LTDGVNQAADLASGATSIPKKRILLIIGGGIAAYNTNRPRI
jgi:hypothetical protein